MRHVDPRQEGSVLHWNNTLFQTVDLAPIEAPEVPEAGEATESDWGEFVQVSEAEWTS